MSNKKIWVRRKRDKSWDVIKFKDITNGYKNGIIIKNGNFL